MATKTSHFAQPGSAFQNPLVKTSSRPMPIPKAKAIPGNVQFHPSILMTTYPGAPALVSKFKIGSF